MSAGGRSAETFTLIIPTHDRAEFVTQAVDSALRQERPFDRIIVVADGLGDPALEILRGVEVEVWPIAHAGVAAARNAGLALVDTDWACFLDDDDLLHPSYLRDLEDASLMDADARAFNAPYWRFAAVAGEREEFSAVTLDDCLRAVETAVPRNDMTYLDIAGHSFDALLARLAGSMSTAAVRTEILREAGGFPAGLIAAEDWTMYVNVARLTEWHVLAERRAFFRDHGGNATHGRATKKTLDVLRAIRSFWAPTLLPTPLHRPIEAYGRGYRYEVLNAVAAARRNGDRAGLREAWRLADAILSRWQDRLFVRMPHLLRAAVWWFERAFAVVRGAR